MAWGPSSAPRSSRSSPRGRRRVDPIAPASQYPQPAPTSAPRRGRLFVISGPSGVGKGSVVRKLLERDPALYFSVSAKTRAPRRGEVDGRDYWFISEEEFERLVQAGAFLEWASMFGHRSGTPADQVDRERSAGRDVILEIDVQGARQVRDRVPDAVLIFLEPPSREELLQRLERRGTERGEALDRRLAAVGREMAAESAFDHRVVNDDLERAAAEVAAIIERYRSSPLAEGPRA